MSIDDYGNSSSQGGSAPELENQVKDDLGQVTEKAKHDLDAIKQRAADDVSDLREQAEAKVGEATDKAKSFASDQKELAAGQIHGVADAISKVADELDNSDQGTVARYARDLASGISSMGKTIEDRDVDDLLGMAQDFGRKQPVAFLGAAALAGFVASRFAMASAQRRDTKPASPSSAGTSPSNTYASSAASGSTSQNPGSSTSTSTGSASSSTYGSSSFGQNPVGGQ